MASSKARSVNCPACGTRVSVSAKGKLATHNRTPDNGPKERCRWSGEPAERVRGSNHGG